MNAITGFHNSNTADAGPPVMRQRLGRAVTEWSVTKAEWIKLWSVRVNVVGIPAAAVALVLLGVLFSALAPKDMGPGGTTTDSVSLAFGGISLSQLIVGVLAALFVGSEYASGLIRTMFGAVARRTRVLRAKAIVFGGATWLAMTIGAFGAFFAGSAVYSGNFPSYSIGDPGVESRAVRRLLRRLRCADRDRRRLPRTQHCGGDRRPGGTAYGGSAAGGACAGHGR